MSTQHTPGPWHHDTAVRSPKGYGFITAGTIDARVMRDPPSGCAVIVATVTHDDDGALIAAAPELLAALRDLTHQIEIGTFFDEHGHSAKMLKAYADARAAIAKAEGQS